MKIINLICFLILHSNQIELLNSIRIFLKKVISLCFPFGCICFYHCLNLVQLVDEQLEEDCKNEEVYDDDDVDRDEEGGDEDDNNEEEEEE